MATHDRPPWYIDLWLVSMRAWANVGLELLAWPVALYNEAKREPIEREEAQDGDPEIQTR